MDLSSFVEADSAGIASSPRFTLPVVPIFNRNGRTEADELSKRLATYANWKSRKSPLSLANAGLVYTGIGDKVQCEYCNIKLYNWLEEEDALEAHRKYAKNCSFIKKRFPESQYAANTTVDNQRRFLGNPKYPKYSDYSTRLESFVGWPSNFVGQQPVLMAKCGFYYMGSADRAKCFHCGVTLRDWDDEDFPPAVHKKWSPGCAFADQLDVDKIRREESVNMVSVQMQNLRADGISQTEHHDSSPENSGPTQATDVDKSDYGHNPKIQAVLEMGYSVEIIEKAIEIRRQTHGDEFPNAVSLFEAILELEQNGD